jgi:hypothetical protein
MGVAFVGPVPFSPSRDFTLCVLYSRNDKLLLFGLSRRHYDLIFWISAVGRRNMGLGVRVS